MNFANVSSIISVVSQAAGLLEEYGPETLDTIVNAIKAVRSGSGPSDAVIAALLVQNQTTNAAIQKAASDRLKASSLPNPSVPDVTVTASPVVNAALASARTAPTSIASAAVAAPSVAPSPPDVKAATA